LAVPQFDVLYVHNDKQFNRSRSLKMDLIGCPETSVRSYHYTLRNIAYEHRFWPSAICVAHLQQRIQRVAVAHCGGTKARRRIKKLYLQYIHV
jgi:hypothetical protein